MICKTTLNKIRAHSLRQDGWKKLLAHLGKTAVDDQALTLKIILESNGLDDALWCLRASDATEFEMRKFARMAALDVAHLLDMPAIAKEYLETGDETKRLAEEAAVCAAWAAESARAAEAAEAAACAAWAAARAAGAAAVKIQTERFISMFCTGE